MSAIRPPDAQPEAVAQGIGQALGSLGDGITAAFKSKADEKKDQLKFERDKELARIKAQADADYRRETLDETSRHNRASEETARAKIDGSGGSDYDDYLSQAGDRIIDVTPKAFQPKKTPQYFPGSKLELGAPPPKVDKPVVSFDSGNNLGALSAPVEMPPQEDQRYTALRNIGASNSPLRIASMDGAGPSEPIPNLPYSLQGGVPKPLADLQIPSTRELYAGSEFSPTPIPTYGSSAQEPSAASGAAPQPSRSPIVAFPISDPNGGVLGYAYYDKVSRKLIPGSYVAETKASASPLAGVQIPEGQKLKGMTISAEGKPSYTYGVESEGKPPATLLQDQTKILTNLEGANSTLDDIESRLKEVGTSRGPLLGITREYNPYDNVAQSVENMVNSLVPGLARGVFGEVGVLTDKDVDRYKKLIPNMRTDPKVAQQIMKDLRKKLDSTKKANLGVWEKAGYDVKGFQEAESSAKTELQTLAKEIDSAKDSNSPDILAKKKRATELFLSLRK